MIFEGFFGNMLLCSFFIDFSWILGTPEPEKSSKTMGELFKIKVATFFEKMRFENDFGTILVSIFTTLATISGTLGEIFSENTDRERHRKFHRF